MTNEQIKARLEELDTERLDLLDNRPINDILDILTHQSFEKFSLQQQLTKQINNPPEHSFPEYWA